MTDTSASSTTLDLSSQSPSIISRLYRGETNFDFIGRIRRWFLLSGLVIIAGLVSLGLKGLNLSIEFEGGSSWEVPTNVSVARASDALEQIGLDDAQIQTLRSSGGERLRVQARTDDKLVDTAVVSNALAKLAGKPVSQVSFTEVGPSWGDEVTDKAIRALVIFLIIITFYIAWRFEWKMALATLAALFHDILVTVGVYSLAGFPVTPATVIAVLTILGYSIYDGIVVFDKVDENSKELVIGGPNTYSAMVNNSLNQVLMRTLNTSITALLPITSLLVIGSLVLGATTLQEFALALLVGLGASAYSSIFIASPTLAVLKEREPRNIAIREKIESKTASGVLSSERSREGMAKPEATGPQTTRAIKARERKKGKRR